MLSQPMKALLLLNVEPELDAANPPAARVALQRSGLVVAMTSFKDAAVENADVLLPIAPFTETAGSFVNAEGRLQSFAGVVAPLGDARPGWKVLRVLGNLLGLPGFSQDSAEQLRAEALGDAAGLAARLDNRGPAMPQSVGMPPPPLERIADVPIYAADALVRRAESLQLTSDARAPVASLPSALFADLGLKAGDAVRVSQGEQVLIIAAVEDPSLVGGVVRVPAGHADTATLGAMFGAIGVTRV
jgi:NADH-quinone oxidoreductase subunit G